jgi:hypothetical protein
MGMVKIGKTLGIGTGLVQRVPRALSTSASLNFMPSSKSREGHLCIVSRGSGEIAASQKTHG